MSAHENLEHAEHAQHAAHEGGNNKKIALIISVLALFLAFSETLGKSAQTVGIELNIRASDTWNFFQAKTIRQTVLRSSAESLTLQAAAQTGDAKAAMIKQADAWRDTATRYESDTKSNEGRKELMATARDLEKRRDLALSRYHNYEFASAAFQIGIVLASAAVITSMMSLAWAAIGVGLLGLLFTGTGLFMPDFPHDAWHVIERLFAGGGGGGEHH